MFLIDSDKSHAEFGYNSKETSLRNCYRYNFSFQVTITVVRREGMLNFHWHAAGQNKGIKSQTIIIEYVYKHSFIVM